MSGTKKDRKDKVEYESQRKKMKQKARKEKEPDNSSRRQDLFWIRSVLQLLLAGFVIC